MNFEDLVKRISPKLRAIAKRLNGRFSFFDEEDLYQEALLYLWEKWRKGEVGEETDSFVLQGCFFFLKNYCRKMGKKIEIKSVRLNDFIPGEDNTWEEIIFAEGVDEHFNCVESNLLIESIRNRLTEREENIFSLYLEGLTTREIGEKLGLSHVMVVKIEKRIRGKCQEFKKEIICTPKVTKRG